MPSQEKHTVTDLCKQHATVEHLNLTTRRCFVGPIPEGWLKSHRKSWFHESLKFSNYSSRAATFTANVGTSRQRQVTGVDGPSVSVSYNRTFPQPEDVDETEDESDGERVSGDRTYVPIPTGDGTTGSQRVDRADDEIGNAAAASRSPRSLKRASGPRKRLHARFERLKSPDSESFVTARSKPGKVVNAKQITNGSAGKSITESFVTAQEVPSGTAQKESTTTLRNKGENRDVDGSSQLGLPHSTNKSSTDTRLGDGLVDDGDVTGSKVHLLPKETSASKGRNQSESGQPSDQSPRRQSDQPIGKQQSVGLVKFNLDQQPDNTENAQLSRTASKIGQAGRQRIWRRLRRGTAHPGEIVKMEKMLVRVDMTRHELPKDFDENASMEIEVRAVEKWREFVIVCRESTTDDCQFSIQLYKTRVIPARQETHVDKQSTHEIPLLRKSTNVNLYSSLDKTLVLWQPWKKQQTVMYILRPHSAASAVEWYTFIRNCLGWQRPSTLLVHVPDLNVTVQLQNPFTELEKSMNAAHKEQTEDAVIAKTMEAEKAVSHSIIRQSLQMLEDNPEWADVLSTWLAKERIGLAWKRYDRLEWVHGANEQRMYGSMAMQQTHELELRPKVHYPTEVKSKDRMLEEPAPVEGFLIRLTSNKGTVQRLGKMYYKRLYFVTHNQYLCYTRPAKALPPPFSDMSYNHAGQVPSTNEIVDRVPMIFAVNPYPDENQDGEVDWLQYGTAASKERHDLEAYRESERQISTLLRAEGYINLCHIVRVQNFDHGKARPEDDAEQGSDVDFHEDVVDSTQDDGQTKDFDDNRTFELVMRNKLVIKLQAYNEIAKREWMHRLRDLIRYWKLRLAHDMALLKTVRATNLDRLDIDEEMEAYLGQFGEKWEVTRSVASPMLFNMCGISCCRAVTVSASGEVLVSGSELS